jgi:hypothetical protein
MALGRHRQRVGEDYWLPLLRVEAAGLGDFLREAVALLLVLRGELVRVYAKNRECFLGSELGVELLVLWRPAEWGSGPGLGLN